MLSKNFSGRWLMIVCLLLMVTLEAFAYPITPEGKKYNAFLDNLDVANHWLPNRYVDWKSGKTLGRYPGAATHCSTFVAATASKLGAYILGPPDHAQLLANAQYSWLRNQGARYGWAWVDNHQLAQQIANQGCLVVIAYANPNRHRPGHVAIVRPSDKSKDEINVKGPQIIQAGRTNYNSVAMSSGFRQYRAAFIKQRIVYYAHSTPYCVILAQKEERGQITKKIL